MNISRFVPMLEPLVLILFSLGIIASAIPTFGNISNTLVLIYYLFVPGYATTRLLPEKYNLVYRLGYSVFFGISFVLAIFALRQIFIGTPLPFNIIIPSMTIAVSIYRYLRPAQTFEFKLESE